MTQYYRCLFSSTRFLNVTSASILYGSKISMNSYIFGIGNETKNLTKKESYTRVLVEAFNNTSILALSFSIFFFIIFAFGLYFLFKKTNFLGQTFSKVQR
jgi:hypothetical protein